MPGVRLLIVTHFFEGHRGGIEIVAGRLARELARADLDVTWAATDAAPPPADAEPRLRTIPLAASNIAERSIGIPFPLPAPSSFARIWREVRGADAVHVHDGLYLTSLAAFAAARWFGKPVVVIQHIGAVPYRNPILRWMMRIANRIVVRPVLAWSDQVVFISESTARYFAGLKPRAKPELIFNGVDTGVFYPPRDRQEIVAARHQLALPADDPVVLFVGRFVEKKGLAVLERLARARPDLTFVFAGWGPLDPRAWRLTNVHVFDALAGPTLAALYRAGDTLVLPSTGEGFPLVVQEALACGLKVVCGDETAAADPEASRVLTSVAIDAGNPDATAARCERALAACLDEGPDAAARLARAKFAAERYSWPRAAARHAEILVHLLARRNGDARAGSSERTPSLQNGG